MFPWNAHTAHSYPPFLEEMPFCFLTHSWAMGTPDLGTILHANASEYEAIFVARACVYRKALACNVSKPLSNAAR